MKTQISKLTRFLATVLVFPFIYGCGSGEDSLVSFLFVGGASGGSEIALLGSAGGSLLGTGGAGVASLVNPEPASMLLVGGGLMAMGYFKLKK